METSIPARLRAARKQSGLTIEQSARMSGIGSATIQRIETGRSSPTIKTLARLSIAYGVQLSEIFQ